MQAFTERTQLYLNIQPNKLQSRVNFMVGDQRCPHNPVDKQFTPRAILAQTLIKSLFHLILE
eukprot:scaffold61051_cov19-Tisochrysis_lutea.AAC.1